jgi:flavin reductase (DIM6/NTAB) family NADH-FMN oxidoreductase RutF
MLDQTREFRQALGCFATGVCVVTAPSAEGPIGLTINSFASVSLDPMLVLWSLDRNSDRFSGFADTKHFTISVLADDLKALSQRLSKKGEHSLDGVDLDPMPAGAPAIAHAMAWFECAAETRHNGGDHVIFVGRVLSFGRRDRGHPLLYYRGRYRELRPLETV